MKILITGSSGMLGQELCGVLSKSGAELSGMDIREPGTRYPSLDKFYEADISDAGRVRKALETERPDVVIHAAAWTDVDGCELDKDRARRINIEGTINVASVSGAIGTKLVFISTDFVFDGRKNFPYKETDELGPLGEYARTKVLGEETVKKQAGDFAIVRTSWLFGPGGKNFVDTIISKSSAEKSLKVVNDQVGSPTYTKDLALALKELIAKGVNGREIYHVCNSGQCSWYEFAVKIKSFVPQMSDTSIVPVSSDSLGRPAARPAFSVMDTGKFTAYTGMELRKWEEALREYISR